MEKITLEDVKLEAKDFFDCYVEILKKDKKQLKSYKKHIVDEYNKTKDTALFLEGLKIIAKAEGKINKLAKAAKVERTSVYRMLSKKNNPSFEKVVTFAQVLGYKINFIMI
jgi:probable addiction module antidote protein